MFHSLLVPLDGTPQSDRVIDLAVRAAAVDSSRLHVLCVVDPAYALSPADADGVEPDGLTYPPAIDQTTRAGRIVEAAVQRLQSQGRIAECPLQMEAIVESLSSVEDEPEGFTVIVARVKAMHAHADVVTFPRIAVDPDRWRPLIFSYRTYRSAETEMGRMNRSVRS